MSNNNYTLIDNYIYLFHTDEYLILPQYPDTIMDKLGSTFSQQSALTRTAPIFSYSNSGPRDVQIQLELHRDMINETNATSSNMKLDLGDDYIDTLLKRIQAIALPRFVAASKTVQPPMVAVRFGDDIFIKGIVNGGVSIQYKKPILDNNKYAFATINFSVYEITPYDADTVSQLGSFRGITQEFKDKSGLYAQYNATPVIPGGNG